MKKKSAKLLEDLEDERIARLRKNEPRESLDKVRDRLIEIGKLPISFKDEVKR